MYDALPAYIALPLAAVAWIFYIAIRVNEHNARKAPSSEQD